MSENKEEDGRVGRGFYCVRIVDLIEVSTVYDVNTAINSYGPSALRKSDFRVDPAEVR